MRTNIQALLVLALLAVALNACAKRENDYWAGVANGVRQKQP
jgi:hypothetical protein